MQLLLILTIILLHPQLFMLVALLPLHAMVIIFFVTPIAHLYMNGMNTWIGLTLLVGDVLVPSISGSMYTLAFLIGLVSCYCSIILVEQVIYAAEKDQKWMPWAAACALIQGG
jgi:hypothetical protein